GGAIQLANNGTDGVQGLQTLTMTNAAATQPGTTILQYAQTTDGQQILVPSNQVVVQAASGDVQTYQIRTAPTSTIAPGVVMASSPALPTQPAEEAARKREVRLMKNRYKYCIYLDCYVLSVSSHSAGCVSLHLLVIGSLH
ncbi:cAMP responsive element binding protein 1, partial [Homo sapiens]